MRPKTLLMFLAAGLLVSCAYNTSYHAANDPEKIEVCNAQLRVYPADVRKDPALYAKVRVAWAGIIVSNNATDDDSSGKILMNTVFEDHYFNWKQDLDAEGLQLSISRLGEGHFRARWSMNREGTEATSADAMKYAAPGKLAIVYGAPESVDADGTIVLRYHYLRIVDPAHYNISTLDYARRARH